jgi:hypothetical protein
MNKERNERIVRLWNDGLSASKIALQLNLSASLVDAVIWRRRRSHGDVTRSMAVRFRRDERNMKIVRLWNSGLSAKEVAGLVGCTKNVVLATVVKHRELGDIARPAIYSRSERGRLGIRARFGVKIKKRKKV